MAENELLKYFSRAAHESRIISYPVLEINGMVYKVINKFSKMI